MRIVCFIIHGIGTQNQNFADPLKEGIHSKLRIHPKLKELEKLNGSTDSKKEKNFDYISDIDFEPIYWANIASSEQDNLYRNVYPELYGKSSFWKRVKQFAPVRSLSIHLIGDVVSYLGKFEKQIKRTVFDQLIDKLNQQIQKGEDFSIIIVAHSLGSVILHDLISALQYYEYTGFDSLANRISIFTMGSPLSLFTLRDDACRKLPYRKWVNFFHPRDPIAFPIEKIFATAKDIQLKSWSFRPMKLHSMYWKNKTIYKLIADEIVEHFENPQATTLMDVFSKPRPEVFQSFLSLAANVGFSEYIFDFEKIPFDEHISTAKEIDICFVYGGHWVNRNIQYIKKALTKPDVVMRVFMLSPNSPSMPGFSYHFNEKPRETIIEEIEGKTKLLTQAVDEARKSVGMTNHIGRLQIYYSLNIINHSFYRFDNVIYYTPRKLSSNKLEPTPIPTLVFCNPSTMKDNNFFRWLMCDLELLKDCSRDAILIFDSSNNQPSNTSITNT